MPVPMSAIRQLGIALSAALALSAGAVHAYPGVGGFMAHSRDDIGAGFTTVSGDNTVVTPSIGFKNAGTFDVPFATTGQCGETNFATGNCSVASAGNTVKCLLK
jgi:hypothetical protein